jgi:bla regulator protein BlaR1
MITGVVAHLWQSTLFAGVAWLVALVLRRNRAQDRYWVWFTASAKFLVPFSLLVEFGTVMPHRASAPMTGTEWLNTATEFSRPLGLSTATVNPHGAAIVTASSYLQAALLALWASGVAALVICWLFRWRRVRALLKSARPVSIRSALEIRVPVMSAPDLIEPGVIGVLRPVLLLPEGIARRFTQAQMDAILVHELCHVGRKDNLTAAIHMAVQAIFWFHPLIWWIGARLLDERERACDEEVLSCGCSPRMYAETILDVCKSYFSAPPACVSGVTGSGLKSRIEGIMRNRNMVGLSRGKKLVLGSAVLASMAAPMIVGILNAPAIHAQDAISWQTKAGGKMAFEVASVKPSKRAIAPSNVPLTPWDDYIPINGLFRADAPLRAYIEFAYKLWPNELQSRELSHLPKWAGTDRYSIEARAPTTNPTKDQVRLMVQSLLADRFQLATHFDAMEGPVFELKLAKAGAPGPKLVSHADGPPCDRPGRSPGDGLPGFPADCHSLNAIPKPGTTLVIVGVRDLPMDVLSGALSGAIPLGLGRPVIDKTGLTGRFDFTLEFAPERRPAADSDSPVPSTPIGPTPIEALHDQLGLKLEPAKGSIPILVIDRVERPSEN